MKKSKATLITAGVLLIKAVADVREIARGLNDVGHDVSDLDAAVDLLNHKVEALVNGANSN